VQRVGDDLPGREWRERSARARRHAGSHAGAGQDEGVCDEKGHAGMRCEVGPIMARKFFALQHRNANKHDDRVAYSAGVTLTRTRMRSPGS
jgi:hypothetical protein